MTEVLRRTFNTVLVDFKTKLDGIILFSCFLVRSTWSQESTATSKEGHFKTIQFQVVLSIVSQYILLSKSIRTDYDLVVFQAIPCTNFWLGTLEFRSYIDTQPHVPQGIK